MLRLMEQKTEELKILKDLYQSKRDAVEAQRELLGEAECERRLKELEG